jgi:hypothetical protein
MNELNDHANPNENVTALNLLKYDGNQWAGYFKSKKCVCGCKQIHTELTHVDTKEIIPLCEVCWKAVLQEYADNYLTSNKRVKSDIAA